MPNVGSSVAHHFIVMKSRLYFVIATLLLISQVAISQSMVILFKDGTSQTYRVKDIDSIKISSQEEEPDTSEQENIYFSKTSSSINIYIPAKNGQYICYPILHKYKDFVEGNATSHYDTWGIENVYNVNKNGNAFTRLDQLFMVGEAEMAMRYILSDGNSYWVGGRHGNEVIERTENVMTIEADGTVYHENDLINLKEVKDVIVRQQSLLYVPLTADSVFGILNKEWSFSDSGLKLSVKVTFREDVNITATYLNMVCLYRHLNGSADEPYLSRYAYKDNEPETQYVVEDGWENLSENDNLKKRDRDCYSITTVGDGGFKCVIQTLKDTRSASGGMFIGTNNNKYNKIYSTYCSTPTVMHTGDTIAAVTTWQLDWDPI